MKAVNNYLKNVMKSVTYAAADVTSEYTSGIHEFTSSNKEFATATYAALKNPPSAIKKSVAAIQESKVYKALDYGAKNLVEDLRTGNFYNKERKDRDELKLSGLDMNWDDLSEFGVDDNWESKKSSSSSSDSGVTAGDMQIVQSIEGSNAALASATVNAVVTTSNNQIKAGRADTALLYMQNERLFGGLHKDITVLGSTMNEIYKLQSATLQNMDKNMSNFFTSEAKLSAERNAILKEMLEMQRNMYKSADQKQKESSSNKKHNRIRWGDINVNGMVNLDAYFGAVKKNIASQMSSLGMGGFGEDSNMLATFMTSPLEGAMKVVVNGVIPATVKAATKEFDATISGVFGNIIGELGNARSRNDDSLMGMLAKFLGVNTGVNRSIDTSKYEKGPIPFDGITRKAIIDVIPTHLRRIEAALTGRPEEMFDYKAGRWVKMSTVKKQFEDIKKNAIRSATSDLREAMSSGVNAVKNGMTNKRDQEEFDKAIEEFEQFLMDNNGRFNAKASAEKNGINYKYPNLRRHYKEVQKIYSDFDYIEEKNPRTGKTRVRHTQNRIRMQLSNKILDAKDAEERQYRDIETSVGNIFQQYFGSPKADTHGKYNSKGDKFTPFNQLNNTKDELGNTIFNYLQNINKELMWVRLNGGAFGGGGSTRSETVAFDKIDLKNDNFKRESNSKSNREQAERERVRQSALNKIQSGKAIDYRAFSEDEQAYLLKLREMISDNAAKNYKSEIKGYNEGAISGFMDKHFFRSNIKSMEDIDKAIKKAEKSGEDKNSKMDAKEEKFFQKIMKRIGSGDTIMGGIIGASGEAFTNLLYTADKAIYEMMYKTELKNDGDNGKKYNGFMDAMLGKMNDAFDKVKDMLNENIIDPLKDRLGIDDDWKKRFKEGAVGVGSKFWGAFKDANSSIYGPMIDNAKDSVNSFKEKQEYKAKAAVTKSRLQKKYKKKNGLTSEYRESNDEYVLMRRLSNIGISSRDILRIKNECTTEEGELDEARYIKALNDLYRKERAKPRWNKNDNYDPLATKKQRDKRYRASVGSTTNILDWGRKNHFYSEDEHELEDRLINDGLIDEAGLDKIRNHSFDKNGNFKLDQYRASLIKIYNRYLTKTHARGTTGRPFRGLSVLSKGEGLINSHGFSTVPKTGVYNVTEPTHIINTEDMHTLSGGKGVRTSVQQALGKEKLAAKAAGFNIAGNASGTIKITNTGVSVDPKEVMEEAKQYIPEAAGGGLVGGILSMVLGLAGGPILGAAIGAGGTIISKSETLKTKLFGKVGEDGKRDGSGLISKTVMDAVHKYVPDMAKYGLAGIIPGLLTPLGPVGGLLVGGAVGLLKNNERFTNKYFGEEGRLHIGSKEKDIISKMLPGALKGAGAGAVIGTLFGGPFGLMGNAALGSALGMMASTEEFKNLILGEEVNGVRMGGIMEMIKDTFAPLTNGMKDVADKLVDAFDKNVIDPLARFINPAIHAIPEVLSIIPRKISQKIMDSKIGKGIEGMLKDHVFTPIKKIILNPAMWLTKKAATVVTTPFRALGKVGDAIQTKRIKNRNANEKTAQERNEFMERVGKGDQISELDKALAAMGTEGGMSNEEGRAILDSLTSIHSTNKQIASSRKSQGKEISKILNRFNIDGASLSSSTKKKALKAIEAGDMEALQKALVSGNLEGKNTGLTQEQFNTLMEGDTGLKSKILKYNDLQRRESKIRGMTKEDKDAEKDALREKLAPLGITPEQLSDPNERLKIMKYFETQVLHNEANNIGSKTTEDLQNENNANIKDIRNILDSIAKNGIKVFDGDDKEIQKDTDRAISAADKATADTNAMFDKRSEDARNTIGAETFDGLDDNVQDSFTAGSRNIIRRSKATKQNKNIKLIKKFGLDPDLINESGGDVNRIIKVFEKCKNIDKGVSRRLNELSKTQMGIVMDFLKRNPITDMLKDRTLTVDDIEYFLSNHAAVKRIENKCKFLLKNGYKAKSFSNFNEIMDIKVSGNNTEEQDAVESIVKEATAPIVEQNGIGTFLLSTAVKGVKGVASLAGKGIKGVAGLAGKGAKSLFSNKEDGGMGIASNIMGGLGNIFGNGGPAPGSGAGLDETDKKGDGKDVISVGGGDLITVRRDSSGNVEPDTSDSRTKTVMNKLSIKESITEKLQAAQLKACEVIKNNFDTSEIKGSKKGKIGWLGMLLMGGLLLKSGLPQKLFNNMIKPLWTDHIKPWITDKAVPWIKNMWGEHVWPLFKKAGNWIMNTAMPKIGELLGTAIGTLITQLPTLIWNGIKGITNVAATALDVATGNKYNAGASTTVDTSNFKYDESGIKDENGNKLSGEELRNLAPGTVLYNAQGAKGVVGENGKVTFEDESMKGASYLATEANAGAHAFTKALGTGRVGLLTRASNATTKYLGKHGTFLTKIAGKGAHALTAPAAKIEQTGAKLHGKYTGWINNAIDNAAERVYKNSGESLETLERVTNGDGSRFSKWFKKATDASEAGTNFMKKVDSGVNSVGSFLSKTKDKIKSKFNIKDKFKGLFSKGAKDVAEKTGEELTEEAVKAAGKEAGESALKEGAEKAMKDVAKATVKEGTEQAAKSGIKSTVKNKATGILAKLITKAKDAIEGLFSNGQVLSKLKSMAKVLHVDDVAKWVSKFKGKITSIFDEALEKGVKKVGSETLKKATSKILFVVFLVTDFLTGCDKAESILGVTETSIAEELTAGLVNALCNLLIVPAIVPGVNWIARKIYGLFDKDLEERQKEADKVTKEYNDKNGTTYSTEELMSRKHSLTGAVGGWFSDRGRDIANGAKSAWKGITSFFGGGKKEKEAKSNASGTIDLKSLMANGLLATIPVIGPDIIAGKTMKTAMSKKTGISPLNEMLNTVSDRMDKTLGDPLKDLTQTNNLDKVMAKAKDGKISIFSKEYWEDKDGSTDNTLTGAIKNIVNKYTKFMTAPMLMIKNSLETLSTDITTVGNVMSGKTTASSNTIAKKATASSSSITKGTSGTFLGNVKSIFGKAMGRIKSFFGLGSGSEYMYGAGGFSKQIDPSVAAIRFNSSSDSEYQTIGNSGCGPAAAVNVLESVYGQGNAVASAAKFAISHGYKETDGGTKPGFFTDYFNRNGLGSQTSYNKSQIERNINNGLPTVIMGSDANGTSSSTPFGRTPHYVTVTGTDGAGNAIVQDPESRYDNQLYPVKSLMKNTSLGVSAFGKNYGRGLNSDEFSNTNSNATENESVNAETVGGLFSSIIVNSKAGKALTTLIGGNSSTTTTSPYSSSNTINSSSVKSGGNFPTYDLDDAQIKGIANILQHEQPGLSGMLAEASLMANLTDINGDENATVSNLIAKATGGWFAHGKSRFNNPGSPSEDAIKAAKAVMLNGKRTIPRYVNEHDCFSDLSSVKTDGNANSITNRGGYKQFKTKIKNKYGSNYTFWGFPNDKADPFGYTSEEKRKEWGDNYYSESDATSGLGSFAHHGSGKFGKGKWGRGTAEQVWWYLKNRMGMSDAGAAGMLGNIEAESGVSFNNVENLLEKRLGNKYNDVSYTNAVDSGEISKEKFLHPMGGSTQYGYGLVQWTSPGRKEGLYDLVKSKNVSISDPGAQLEWLGTELSKSYSGVLNTLKSTSSVQEASDAVLGKFEVPKNWQSQSGARAAKGQKYYDKLKGTMGEEITGAVSPGGAISTNDANSDRSGETNQEADSIVSMLSNIVANSPVGKALSTLIGGGTTSVSATAEGSGNAASSNVSSNASGDAAKVVEIAMKEVGTKEKKTNEVKYNDWYYGRNVNGSAYPWCAAFVSWVGNQAGIPTSIIPKDASTVSTYGKLVKNGGKISNSEARPGDIIYFTKNGSSSGIYHTGIVTGNDGGKISTVEGNSSDMVKERSYETNSSKVLVARPQYKNAGTVTNYSNNSDIVSDAPDYSNTRGGNGVKPLSRFGQFKRSIYGTGVDNRGIKTAHSSNGGYDKVEYSLYDKQLGNAMKLNSRKTTYSKPRVGLGEGPNTTTVFGMAGSPDYSKLINSIISILMSIADNTDKLNTIVNILNNKLGANISASDVSKQNAKQSESLRYKLASSLGSINSDYSKFNNAADSIADSSINSIISAMNMIASE